jgi:D-methionine transport system ATP-binding protein
VYDAPDVPSDWISRASQDLGVALSVLGASVQVVGGTSIGGVTLGAPAELGDRVRDVLVRYGLSAEADRSGSPAVQLEGVA